jgi:uncharacterized protein YbjT (DUF2867 family)
MMSSVENSTNGLDEKPGPPPRPLRPGVAVHPPLLASAPLKPLVLVTGATGYIGGRLVPRLLQAGYPVRCLVRHRSRLQGRLWHHDVQVVEGDVLEPESLVEALRGVHMAYYLIHSLGAGADFHERDLKAAENFGAAARLAGADRIVYLGGLANSASHLSKHLHSRHLTGDMLRRAGVPVTEFQAAVIVGSSSISFEIIRHLTERLPLMVCPSWVYTKTQPIGIRDVMDYLIAALSTPESINRVIEIGGSDVVTYGDMMMIYARVRGLRRFMVRVPVPDVAPRLSSLWVSMVTPIPGPIAGPLIKGLRNENVVRDPSASCIFPQIHPGSYRTAVERALERLEAANIETAWSDALSTSQRNVARLIMEKHGGVIVEHRQRVISAPPSAAFEVFTGVGGQRGWFYMDWAWEVRGFIDRMIGGVGLRRGRRDPDVLRVGDALDFWRVEELRPGRLLRLRAEMKVPGRAWLEFEATRRASGETKIRQTAFFAPRGLAGWIYWYALHPIHSLIFSGFIDQIARRAERLSDA